MHSQGRSHREKKRQAYSKRRQAVKRKLRWINMNISSHLLLLIITAASRPYKGRDRSLFGATKKHQKLPPERPHFLVIFRCQKPHIIKKEKKKSQRVIFASTENEEENMYRPLLYVHNTHVAHSVLERRVVFVMCSAVMQKNNKGYRKGRRVKEGERKCPWISLSERNRRLSFFSSPPSFSLLCWLDQSCHLLFRTWSNRGDKWLWLSIMKRRQKWLIKMWGREKKHWFFFLPNSLFLTETKRQVWSIKRGVGFNGAFWLSNFVVQLLDDIPVLDKNFSS